jgi:hypothetical protein
LRLRFMICGLASAVCCVLATRPAGAVDAFEIQVYEADVNRPGQFALELHTNYTIKGSREREYADQVPPHGVGRFTLEPALGVTNWLELGMYLQTLAAPEFGFRYAGVKGRAKFVLPTKYTDPFFFGINIEIGRVPRLVEEHGWANEFRPILGYDNGWVLIDFNPIFGYALSGPEKFKPDFEPAGKFSLNTQAGFALGVEYYAGLGLLQNLPPVSKQEHILFYTFDLKPPKGQEENKSPWELNVAIGRGLTNNTGAQWIAKAIMGRSF